MKKTLIVALMAVLLCSCLLAQDDPQPIWEEKVSMISGQSLDLVAFIAEKPGKGFYVTAERVFLLNGNTKTTYAGFNHNSVAVVTALADFELTIRGLQ